MRLLIGMTTADRAPGPNYVGPTLAALHRSSALSPDQVHVFASAPDVTWLRRELAEQSSLLDMAVCSLHVPDRPLTRNENGIALMTGLPECDWVLHLEDDVAFCHDFVGSVERWLTAHARDDRRGYFFYCGWGRLVDQGEVFDYPIAKSNWIQAVALRYADAVDFGQWAHQQLPTWRRGWSDRWRLSGFDELLKIWAKTRYPTIDHWLATYPCFVQHMGRESLVHKGRPHRSTPAFAGEDWTYLAKETTHA